MVIHRSVQVGPLYLVVIAFLLVSVFTACTDDNKSQRDIPKVRPIPSTANTQVQPPQQQPNANTGSAGEPEAVPSSDDTPAKGIFTRNTEYQQAEQYSVVLEADEQLQLPGIPGEMTVWIGHSDFTPDSTTGMTRDVSTLAAVGVAARIEPYAPAFTIQPAATQCIAIHHTGSKVRFQLTPKQGGTFKVGANIFLYNNSDCSGSPVPKTAESLSVTVEVNQTELVQQKIAELWEIFWQQLKRFWAASLILFFGLILFLVKGKLKQWFGYQAD